MCERLLLGAGVGAHAPTTKLTLKTMKTFPPRLQDVGRSDPGRKPWRTESGSRVQSRVWEPHSPGVALGGWTGRLSRPPPHLQPQLLRCECQHGTYSTPTSRSAYSPGDSRRAEQSPGSGDVTEPPRPPSAVRGLAIFPKTAWDAASPAAEFSPRKTPQRGVCRSHRR